MTRIIVKSQDADVKISRHIYGHFSEHLGHCIYGGLWVGNDEALSKTVPNTRGIRRDVVEALRKIRIPNLRWPGGCFADEYHWEDGVGPREKRPRMVNTSWGGVVEDNSFGTHEFLDLCEQLSPAEGPRCEPYICGNVGSGTVRELSQWVEYCNFDGESPQAARRAENGRASPWGVKFWGVGNESWGCGGNMCPEYYASAFKNYATYVRKYAEVQPFKIACGPNVDDYRWTEVLMEKAGPLMDGLSFHYYTVPGDWTKKGSATDFDERDWIITMRKAWRTEELLTKHSAIMDRFDAKKRVALVMDEWGAWYDVEPGTNPGFLYQQNTMRDALIAGVHLNIFNNHADRLRMANIAQTINVLQSLILIQGAHAILTPTYHVFDMYKDHQDALRVPVYIESEEASGYPLVTASASQNEAGVLLLTLTNSDCGKEQPVRVELRGIAAGSALRVEGTLLSAEAIQAHNTFEKPDAVKPREFKDAGVKKTNIEGSVLSVTLPPHSVAALRLG